MRIVRSLESYQADADLLLSIGVFDGVHIGHRAVLSKLLAARKQHDIVGAMTFERHPQEFLHPGQAPKAITTVDEKINLLAACGLDLLFLLQFDERIQTLSAETFLQGILIDKLRTRRLIVGDQWRFGKDRTGDVELARKIFEEHHRAFEAAPLLERDGEKVSSSRIRALVLDRRFEAADTLLGCEYQVRGIVQTGDGRGQVLGFPTANLNIPPEKLIPPSGVYACTAQHNGKFLRAVTSIGDKPTFGGGEFAVEVYLLDFNQSIYGDQLTLMHWHFLREQQRFAGAADLIRQMREDVVEAERTFTATSWPS